MKPITWHSSPSRAVRRERPMPWREGHAVITGASQGLGRAMAEECARRGMNLILVALPGSGLEHAAHNIAERFRVAVEHVEMDLTAPESPEALARWISDHGLDVSVLINNAGVGYNTRFDDSTLRENEACILLNNLALVKITRLLLPRLATRERAYVLNVASLAAFFPMPFMPVYAPSKAFILNFGLAIRQELARSAVSVSTLCPNGIRTNRECTAKIEGLGLAARMTCMDADQVARCAIEGMLADRAVIVPGFLNQIIRVAAAFVPRTLAYAVVSSFWGKTARCAQRSQPPVTPSIKNVGVIHESVPGGVGAL